VDGRLSIGELAHEVGVNASALRFYETEGILTPAGRDGGRRWYEPEAVERVRFIRFCQQLGFSLADVRGLLAEPTDKAAKRRWRKLIDAKMRELDVALAKAAVVREVLAHSRNCDCVSLEKCSLVA
jgi:MerR family transcriptional regulator, redox-sensitive transcriptional activator SoxR